MPFRFWRKPETPTADPSGDRLPDPASILRRARRLKFRVRPETAAALAGAYHSARPGIGLTFSELRAYEPGDDVRYLDWNVTARQGRPYVRRFVEERALTLWLVVDISASMRFGRPTQTKADRAAQCAALLAAAAIQSGDRVGLILTTDQVEFELPPSGGVRHLARILRALIVTPAGSSRSRLGCVLPRVRRARHRALFVLLSDFIETEPPAIWRAAATRHDLVGMRMVDPLELQLPNVGLLHIEDPESHERAVIDTSARRVREAYEAQAADAGRAFARWCSEAMIEAITFRTDQEPMTPLLRFLQSRSRGRLRRPPY